MSDFRVLESAEAQRRKKLEMGRKIADFGGDNGRDNDGDDGGNDGGNSGGDGGGKNGGFYRR